MNCVCAYVAVSLLDEASASVWEEYTAHMQRHWKCPQCGENMVVSVTERLHHESTCQHHLSAPSCESSCFWNNLILMSHLLIFLAFNERATVGSLVRYLALHKRAAICSLVR